MWAGLGQRAGAPAPRPADPAGQDPDYFERDSIQRTVPAAGAPSIVRPGAARSAFDHPFRPTAGSADTSADDSAADTPAKEKPVQRQTKTDTARKPRPTKGASARFQICALLTAKGDLTREELLADVSCDRTAFTNAVFNAKRAEHIVFIAKTDKWHITAAGKDWTSGGANLDNQQAATSSPAEVKRGRRQPREKSAGLPKSEKQRLGVVDTGGKKRKKPKARRSPVRVHQPKPAAPTVASQLALSEPARIQVVQERSFRCAVVSDGGFFLHKGEKQIELTPEEHREMLNYIDRVRGVDTPEHRPA
jgi:hypothetical protein